MGRISCAVCPIHPLWFPFSINPVTWATGATDHPFDLLPKSLVDQRVYEGVDGRIEHDHYRRCGICHVTKSVAGAKIAQEEGGGVSKPTDSKDDTDKYHHQSHSFTYFHYSLHKEFKFLISIPRTTHLGHVGKKDLRFEVGYC